MEYRTTILLILCTYICTCLTSSLTAPVPGTVDDFWQMMWDQRINIVVMLTKTMEGSKVCKMYTDTQTLLVLCS